MRPDKDPQPAVPESSKDVFDFAKDIAYKGFFAPDPEGGVVAVFYGRATIEGISGVPISVTHQYKTLFHETTEEVTIGGVGDGFVVISHVVGTEDFISKGSLPNGLWNILINAEPDLERMDSFKRGMERRAREMGINMIRRG